MPAVHLVHFILDAVEALDLREVKVTTGGTGRERYPPRTLLGLLLYSYATGGLGATVSNSRRTGSLSYVPWAPA